MAKIDYEARVAQGISLLDAKFPDWAGLINLGTLEIRSGRSCVTAQLAGAKVDDFDYVTGMDLLGLDLDTEFNTGSYTEHGFIVESDVWPGRSLDYNSYEAYETLNRIWKREIAARQQAASEGDI